MIPTKMPQIALKVALSFAASFAALAVFALPGFAQADRKVVSVESDWTAMAKTSADQCWATSSPKKTVNTRNGKAVSVNRGDIILFASFYNAPAQAPEISFTGGYPFAEGSIVALEIDGTTRFDLITDGEWSWSPNKEMDAKITEALQRGGSAILTARSTRGTQTKDTFSLSGFTAAVAKAKAACQK